MPGVQPVEELPVAGPCPIRPGRRLDLDDLRPGEAKQARAERARPHRREVGDYGVSQPGAGQPSAGQPSAGQRFRDAHGPPRRPASRPGCAVWSRAGRSRAGRQGRGGDSDQLRRRREIFGWRAQGRHRERRARLSQRHASVPAGSIHAEHAGDRGHGRHVIGPAERDGTPAVRRTQQEARSAGRHPPAPGEARERRPAGDQLRRVSAHLVPRHRRHPGELRADLGEHGNGRRRGGHRRPVRHAGKRHRAGRCPVQHLAPVTHASLSARIRP